MRLQLDRGGTTVTMVDSTQVSCSLLVSQNTTVLMRRQPGSNEDGQEVALEPRYRVGDTVGCGVDLTTRSIWYTRNGTKLQSGFENVQGRLFPLLGLSDDVVLETNFTGPFVWKGGADSEKKMSGTYAGEGDKSTEQS